MTNERAKEIEGLLDEEGKIDADGYITGCPVWTTVIQKILDLGELIFYDNDKGKMQICDWPEDLNEPEWKQAIRKTLPYSTTIDDKGYVHGMLWTATIRRILELGGSIMVVSTGEAVISNWKDC